MTFGKLLSLTGTIHIVRVIMRLNLEKQVMLKHNITTKNKTYSITTSTLLENFFIIRPKVKYTYWLHLKIATQIFAR